MVALCDSGAEDATCVGDETLVECDGRLGGRVPGTRTTHHHHLDSAQQRRSRPARLRVQARIPPQPKGLLPLAECEVL